MSKTNVVLTRIYQSSLDDLWALWTTKEGFESWWGPEGFRVEVSAIEAHPKGALHYEMIADSPEMIAAMKQMGQPTSHAVRSTFSEVLRHERLSIASIIDFLDGVPAYESTMAVDFSRAPSGVRMVVTLEPHPDANFTKMSVDGFTSQLGKLDKRFTRSAEA